MSHSALACARIDGAMSDFWQGLVERLRTTFDPNQLGMAAARLLESVIVAVLVFAVYYVIWRVINTLARTIIQRTKTDPTTSAFVLTVLQYGFLILGLIHGLDAAGINTAGILASLGIAGLTIGFAARDALSNVISGILIFWDRPFVIGDLIEVGGRYGRVDRITLRSTRVVTVDGKMLAVPNTEIINSTVASYTNFPHLRLDVTVSVGTGEDLGRVRHLLLELASADPAYMDDPRPSVVVVELNDYNVKVELRVWIDDERNHVAKRFELRERVFEALRAAGVEMPLETVQLAPFEVGGPSRSLPR